MISQGIRLSADISGLWFGGRFALTAVGVTMPQELSVSYQAVKTKVHRLMDAAVEGTKVESDIHTCIRRWWCLVQPADRAVARRYLLEVLEKSNATLKAISEELSELEGFTSHDRASETLTDARIQSNSTAASSPI
jgi:hypothetical protein